VLGLYVFAARWFDDRNLDALIDEQFRPMPRFLKPWLPKLIRKRILKHMSSMEFIRRGQDDYWRNFQEHLDKLEDRAPESGVWVGNALSVADIGLFPILHSLRTQLSQWQMQEIAKRPKLSAWLDRVDAATQEIKRRNVLCTYGKSRNCASSWPSKAWSKKKRFIITSARRLSAR
jgi:glutathione S-transferase